MKTHDELRAEQAEIIQLLTPLNALAVELDELFAAARRDPVLHAHLKNSPSIKEAHKAMHEFEVVKRHRLKQIRELLYGG